MPSPAKMSGKRSAHVHGPRCGHLAVPHEGHVDYLDHGRLEHSEHGRTHQHAIAVSNKNPDRCDPRHHAAGHDAAHRHGLDCGHEAVPMATISIISWTGAFITRTATIATITDR